MKIPQYRLTELSESWFQSNREEFAAMLASGETLVAYGKPLLNFEDLENLLFSDQLSEIRTAMQLCAISPELGGKHVQKILDAVAQKLVDEFQDAFRASYEQEINQRDAA